MTFDELLGQFSQLDDLLADPEFDPKILVERMRTKVDGLKAVIDRMDNSAEGLEKAAAPIVAKAKAIRNNRKSLMSYITHAMETHDASSDQNTFLPGHLWQLRLRKASIPSLHIPPATPLDYSSYFDYVERAVVYTWKNDLVKKSLKIGALPAEFPGKLVTSNFSEFKLKAKA